MSTEVTYELQPKGSDVGVSPELNEFWIFRECNDSTDGIKPESDNGYIALDNHKNGLFTVSFEGVTSKNSSHTVLVVATSKSQALHITVDEYEFLKDHSAVISRIGSTYFSRTCVYLSSFEDYYEYDSLFERFKRYFGIDEYSLARNIQASKLL
jgi:hypothetical protein